MYDDSDDVQVPEMRQRMDGESSGTPEAVPKLSPVEMGHAVAVGEEEKRGGCVYFIETHDGAFVKIGYSIHVPRRFDEIGVMLPGLRLIGYMPGTMATERWLHAKFAAHRERGEWFRHNEDVSRFIANLGLIPPPEPKPVPEPEPMETKRTLKKPTEKPTENAGIMDDEKKRKDPGAVSMAKRRAASLTPERRSEIAAKAAATRWGTKKKAGKKKTSA